jgi:hypothetical protein
MQNEPPKAEPPKRKRRWFQFSLRTMLIAVTIVAVECAFCFRMLREWETIHLFDKTVPGSKSSAGSPNPGNGL